MDGRMMVWDGWQYRMDIGIYDKAGWMTVFLMSWFIFTFVLTLFGGSSFQL